MPDDRAGIQSAHRTCAPVVNTADTARMAGSNRRPLRPFIQIAAALKRQANQLGDAVNHMQANAPQIGLSPTSAARAIFDTREEAALLSDAFRIISGLVDVEGTMRAVLGEN
jgi:hypothetical protein